MKTNKTATACMIEQKPRISAKRHEELYREFIRVTNPYRKRMLDIYNTSLPKYTVLEDGTVQNEFAFTEQQQESLDNLNLLIEQARDTILGGFDLNPTG